jgi:hypothetical protein
MNKPLDFYSIDWDFFIRNDGMIDGHMTKVTRQGKTCDYPSTLIYDWGANDGWQNPLVDLLWHTRAMNFPEMGLDIKERLSWHREGCVTPEAFLRVLEARSGGFYGSFQADSHVYGYVALRDICEPMMEDLGREGIRVWHFDAHHDLGYGDEQCDRPNAGNWLFHTMKDFPVLEVNVVYPDWLGSKTQVHTPLGDYASRVRFWSWAEFVVTKPIMDLGPAFICRSSAWTPPWLDLEFENLTSLMDYPCCLDCELGGNGSHDACKPREWADLPVDVLAKLKGLGA